VLPPHQQAMLVLGTKAKEPAMAEALKNSIAFVGIDIGKNSFHVVGLDKSGVIVLRQKWSRGTGCRVTVIAPSRKHRYGLDFRSTFR
jgi:hypothetical protein